MPAQAPAPGNRRRRFPSMRYLIAVLACLAGLQALAETRFDFGEALQGDAVEHEFRLRNHGDQPLRIDGVSLSPGMRLARAPAVLAAGESAALKLTLDTARIQGVFEGRLVVRHSQGRAAEFTLTGKVVPPIEVLPHPAFFVSTTRGTGREASLEIVNREAAPVELSLDAAAAAKGIRLEPIEAGRRFRLSLVVPANAPAGQRSDRIALRTSSARRPLLHVAVNTKVHERVHTFPDAVDLGHLRRGDLGADGPPGAHAQTLMVYQAGGHDFSVRARSDVPGLVLDVQPAATGDRAQVTISLSRTSFAAGPVEGSIILETNDPRFPELRVPVTGRILPD